jgi:protein-tyrosine phosphatase
MIKVLFVCLGNICRSPMAEAVFQKLVNDAGLGGKFKIDSAGTSGWHNGERAHAGTLEVLRRNGITYNGRSRQFTHADLETFDYIVVMDRANLVDVHRILGTVEPSVTMFLQYANKAGTVNVTEVPDPYYTGGFDEVYRMIVQGSTALLNHIRLEQGI